MEKRFRELYGNLREYKEINRLELNGKHYILAYWLEDNSPLQLTVDIFRYTDSLLSQPVTKVFSGGVAEEVQAIVHFDLTGDSQDELIFVSDSGQIQIVRVLQDQKKSFAQIFMNGGSEVTIIKSTREIWIKAKTAGVLEVYRWDPSSKKFLRTKTLEILF
ncbi:MAG: hypothetical protein HY234_12945 [Acidobacteria bacterium]|nr:hypothetical protein [Acidobacteriota bacterium]